MTDALSPTVVPPESAAVEREPLVCENSDSMSPLLTELGISLAVSTYQAGKLILARSEGEHLNAHFRSLKKPMGLASRGDRLFVGTAQEVVEYRNLPAVASKLEPAGKHDACYVPRSRWITGNVDIHEMALDDQNALWFINTRFSCLCTLDGVNSFVPRWRPAFVKGLGPEDRCHLNGLGLRDGKPRYVTALGESDAARGWRANKASGGVLMDMDSGETICRGLSMPHSPRWHANRLWVLESGKGTLATVDVDTGRLHTVLELPGFTRGLDFSGSYAFIGLSQVRETALFSGLPLTDRVQDRVCGVAVVDLRVPKLAGFLKFTSGVHEIFAVQVLRNRRYPELLPWDDARVATSFVMPDAALRDLRPPTETPTSDNPVGAS